MIFFNSACVDDFFENPDEVREWGLSLPKDNTVGNYPGVRSKELGEVNSTFKQNLMNKLFSIYFNEDGINVKRAECFFQEVKPLSTEVCNMVNRGWVHNDGYNWSDDIGNIQLDHGFASVIYLNPNPVLDTGTSIFEQKKKTKWSKEWYDEFDEIKKDLYLNRKPVNENRYNNLMRQNNEDFIETIRYNNVYNRAITYDIYDYHCANSYYTEEERLTIVSFFYGIGVDKYPLDRIKNINTKI